VTEDEAFWEKLDELPPEESTIEEMRAAGADLDAPQYVEHYLLFPFVSQAQGAAEELRGQGYAVGFDRDFEEDEWTLVAARQMPVSVRSLRQIRDQMEKLAGARGGSYDGWNVRLEGIESGVPVADEDDYGVPDEDED
jgi:regulator of RNase E activity RraB